jgi:signal transduction histidine kinase
MIKTFLMRKFWLGTICLAFLCSSVSAKNRASVRNGILDLRTWNWRTDGIANLTGDWEFYSNKFYSPSLLKNRPPIQEKKYISVPSLVNGFGYATYHLTVLCPPEQGQLALKFLTVESAYRLFVNGKELLNVGHADTTDESTIPDLRPAIVLVTPENNKLDIVIQVSNFQNKIGGLWDFVKLGTSDQIYANLITNISVELLVAGGFLLATFYYLILFLHFKKRYLLICFSILCFIIFIRSFVTGEMPVFYILNANWEFARRMEYISLYLSVPVMSLFSYYLFPKDFSRKVLHIILPVCALFVILSLFASYYFFTYPVRYYQVIMLVTAFYGFYVYVRAALKKRPGGFLFLTSFCIFFITILNDVLYVNLIINSIPLFYVGLSIFVVTLSILISRQFTKIFSDLEVANFKLSAANNELEIVNSEIKEKNEELKKINHELDSFVHRISHDLKEPLTSVLAINKVAYKESDSQTSQSYLAMQEKTLTRMDKRVGDIIDFSKNKRLQLDLKEVDFKELVENSLEDHAFMNNAQNIKKNVEVNQYEKFISDPRRISVIINNLISNAIKYSNLSGGHPEINIKVSVADNMATIQVSDNGLGIEEQHLDKIFVLFYRITSSTTGSGLGLYIVKETVEKLKGYITINSTKGKGTNIKIILPDMGHEL